MLRRLRKLLALPWSERILLAEAGLALVSVRAALAVGGVRLCTPPHGEIRATRARSLSSETLSRIGLAVGRAAAPLRMACLPQSLAVIWLLRRRGVNAELRYGAKLAGGVLEAHAWVVVPSLDWSFDSNPGGGYAPLEHGSAR